MANVLREMQNDWTYLVMCMESEREVTVTAGATEREPYPLTLVAFVISARGI